eukprot:NODE_3850_length_885_cov_25.945910_g3697_i0.p1 GENE.NODE_3850_length_885_cov_25.945910_g3697_i0~~NODE_3850_length_885_cov_25.945910_g3697_i0.p1  ORF type:complete len:223 (-),score=47.41 NODE_3850_length_885_cov_25.945910_g3697_i0:144-812(-)
MARFLPRLRPLLSLALPLGIACTGAVPLMAKGDTVLEPVTGLSFDMQVDHYTLFGVACRKKYGLAKVYAVGVYIGPQGIEACSPALSQSPSQLNESDLLTKILTEGQFPKVLRLIFFRKVDSRSIADALKQALTPRLDNPQLLMLFESKLLAHITTIEPGHSLQFSWDPATDRMTIQHNTATPTDIPDAAALTTALFDVYLGPQSVTPELRSSVIDGMMRSV